MQQELFCSIVPPEQLFVRVGPSPPRSPCTIRQPAFCCSTRQPQHTHTHKELHSTLVACYSAVLGLVDSGIKRRGVPLHLKPESQSG